MITEAEARTKMCPILEVRSHLRAGGEKPQHCWGSHCMMWRNAPVTTIPKGAITIEPVGYCGMAGKP